MTHTLLGHCAIYHRTLPVQQSLIKPYGIRPVRDPAAVQEDIHVILCTKAEHRWLCRQLAKRRAKKRTRSAAKAKRSHQDR